MDGYLEAMNSSQIVLTIIQGDQDQTVPMECIHNMKLKVPSAEVKIISNANHQSLILANKENFTKDLEHIWASSASEN
ncbi:hypothetical protein BVC80_1321g65 [Macleaya cordata]|uniref:Uncharacterized protein n=1 Tax=Macleaya cordata TaxID=56857 RepID=A0A200Q0E0_MACCD|nr:hypothetical protein BVC80_1321g65 [Macleaya cordata]